MQFLDAVHESSKDLRKLLLQRKLPTADDLERNILCWIELINGTEMAAAVLSDEELQEDIDEASSGDHDLVRFGRSVKRLYNVLVDDFVTTVVENLLIERTRFACYLMRCPHLLIMDDIRGDADEISPDLRDTQAALSKIVRVCDENDGGSIDYYDDERPFSATQTMRDRVLSLVAEKLLEVALDPGHDLFEAGCAVFARDVEALFGNLTVLPNHALRVLDIVKLMKMDSQTIADVGTALRSLSGAPAPLTEDIFDADERLFEEAMSMIRAKGLIYLELSDFFAILNRRRDLI
jgi:hypothetical protein